MHDTLYILALLVFLSLPVLLALKWGDRLAEAWDRRRLRRLRRRRRSPPLPPEALPGQDVLLTGLKAAEERSEAIDLQISERLLDLQRFTVNAYKQRQSGSASDLLKPAGDIEALAVKKEGRLNFLLDIACLQSDRIDAMTAEVEALSQIAGWDPPRTDPETPETPRQEVPRQEIPRQEIPRQEVPRRQIASPQEVPASATNQLLQRIEEASRKRQSIDERLKKIKPWKPPAQKPPPQTPPPPDPDAGQKGSRFDTTIQ